MATKANPKKAKTATPKAPSIVYVEIKDCEATLVSSDPLEVEDAREHDDARVARYKFDSFVEVEFRTVVTDVAE